MYVEVQICFRAFERKNNNLSSTRADMTEAMVFAELIDYVESGVKEGIIFIYKLSELHLLFEDRLRHCLDRSCASKIRPV